MFQININLIISSEYRFCYQSRLILLHFTKTHFHQIHHRSQMDLILLFRAIINFVDFDFYP